MTARHIVGAHRRNTMDTNFKSPVEDQVDRLFSEIKAKYGECCTNPVTGGGFVWGIDPITTQKKEAVAALHAREWFAVNGPTDAPPLPLTHADVEDYRNARGLAGIVGFYARSLSREGYGRRRYDFRNHPSFDDFARGLMAINTGLWRIESDQKLQKRFPARPLKGMTRSAFWAPPKEYEELEARSHVNPGDVRCHF
jgi:hypothetical protein